MDTTSQINDLSEKDMLLKELIDAVRLVRNAVEESEFVPVLKPMVDGTKLILEMLEAKASTELTQGESHGKNNEETR